MAAVLGAVAVFAVTSGSAATTTKPYTASFAPIPPLTVAGGSPATITLTLTNLANPQSLGSANVTAAALGASSFTITGATPSAYLDPTQSFPASLLKLRNLNIQPNGVQRSITINVTTPCAAGDYTWGVRAKQSNDFSGPPGNDFTFRAQGSNLVTRVTECYHVEFINQPKTTVVSATIADADYSRGDPIDVGVFDNSNVRVPSCAIAAAGSEVTITKAPSAGSLGGDASEPLACSAGGLVATFDDLSIGLGNGLSSSDLPKSYTLTASGLGTTDPSDSFNIIYGVPCTTSGCPSFTTSFGGNQVTSSATAGTFTFLAIIPSSIPDEVVAPGAGCEYYKRIPGGAFEAVEGRSSDTGELRFTYYVKKAELEKLYGSTSGQQFVPLCAGAAWVDGSGKVKRCDSTDPNRPTAWVGKELGLEGKFTGYLRQARCDTTTGLYWGILGSFQDYNHADTVNHLIIAPDRDPTVTGWGSGGNFRNFDVRVPSPWDWKMG